MQGTLVQDVVPKLAAGAAGGWALLGVSISDVTQFGQMVAVYLSIAVSVATLTTWCKNRRKEKHEQSERTDR